jgi:mono/diheme cytochrome c family protein
MNTTQPTARRHRHRLALALFVTALAAGAVSAQTAAPAPATPPTRGQLLYATHCIGCHTTQMHWREQKLATDWRSLKEQVARWQQRELLSWSEADIVEVTRHLNDAIYNYPRTEDRVSRSDPVTRTASAAPAP